MVKDDIIARVHYTHSPQSLFLVARLPLSPRFLFVFGHAACAITVPGPGIKPVPLQRKHRVLITGLLGKSQILHILSGARAKDLNASLKLRHEAKDSPE